MDRTNGGAPLLSLDAVVIDTETTGLDPRKARVIELAGVRLSGGRLAAGGSFRQLLRPADESIPAVTEHDVLRVIDQLGATALELPVGQIMSKPLASVPADAFVYRAIGRMNRLRTRHLGVVDETGHVVGALSARDRGGHIARRPDRRCRGRARLIGCLGEAAAGRGSTFGGRIVRP
jgi:Exonuclease/CBS domain